MPCMMSSLVGKTTRLSLVGWYAERRRDVRALVRLDDPTHVVIVVLACVQLDLPAPFHPCGGSVDDLRPGREANEVAIVVADGEVGQLVGRMHERVEGGVVDCHRFLLVLGRRPFRAVVTGSRCRST